MRQRAWYEPALERDWIPDTFVRAGIRQVLRARLAEESRLQRKAAFVRSLADGPIAVHTADANAQHYEVPAEFFELVLGHRLKYSAALWDDGVDSLDAAEDAMLGLTAERAEIADGQRILDLGCG